jgi:hypothetical protein
MILEKKLINFDSNLKIMKVKVGQEILKANQTMPEFQKVVQTSQNYKTTGF